MTGRVETLRANALAAYDVYFRMCVDHPEISSFAMAEQHMNLPHAKDLWDCTDLKPAKYVWFVAYMLKVFNDLLEYDSADEWRDAVLFQLNFHREALDAIWPYQWAGIYGDRLAALVERVIKKVGDAQA